MKEKNFESIVISQEIRDLIKDVDTFVNTKDELIENLKRLYLKSSSNN